MTTRQKQFNAGTVSFFGEKLMLWREYAGVSQRQLGIKTGIGGATISRFESGQRQPTLTQLFRMANVLGITPGTMLEARPLKGVRDGI